MREKQYNKTPAGKALDYFTYFISSLAFVATVTCLVDSYIPFLPGERGSYQNTKFEDNEQKRSDIETHQQGRNIEDVLKKE